MFRISGLRVQGSACRLWTLGSSFWDPGCILYLSVRLGLQERLGLKGHLKIM